MWRMKYTLVAFAVLLTAVSGTLSFVKKNPNRKSVEGAIGTIIGEVLTGAKSAAKKLIAHQLKIDKSVLDDRRRTGEVVEVALEKIVDNMNGHFLARKPDTGDSSEELMDYYRLSLQDKVSLLISNLQNATIEGVELMNNMTDQIINSTAMPQLNTNATDASDLNSTIITTTTATVTTVSNVTTNNTLPPVPDISNTTTLPQSPQEIMENNLLNLLRCLFTSLEELFYKFQFATRGCVDVTHYQRKVNQIKADLNKIIDRVNLLKIQDPSGDDETTNAQIDELKECFLKLVRKLFTTMDSFFRKNSHVHDGEFHHYKKLYLKLKSDINRLIEQLLDHQANHGSGDFDDHDTADFDEIESKDQLKRLIKCLIKKIDTRKRDIERNIAYLNKLKKSLYKIKCELISLLTKFEYEESDAGVYDDDDSFLESDKDRNWAYRNREIIVKFKRLAKKFYRLRAQAKSGALDTDYLDTEIELNETENTNDQPENTDHNDADLEIGQDIILN